MHNSDYVLNLSSSRFDHEMNQIIYKYEAFLFLGAPAVVLVDERRMAVDWLVVEQCVER